MRNPFFGGRVIITSLGSIGQVDVLSHLKFRTITCHRLLIMEACGKTMLVRIKCLLFAFFCFSSVHLPCGSVGFHFNRIIPRLACTPLFGIPRFKPRTCVIPFAINASIHCCSSCWKNCYQFAIKVILFNKVFRIKPLGKVSLYFICPTGHRGLTNISNKPVIEGNLCFRLFTCFIQHCCLSFFFHFFSLSFFLSFFFISFFF